MALQFEVFSCFQSITTCLLVFTLKFCLFLFRLCVCVCVALSVLLAKHLLNQWILVKPKVITDCTSTARYL